MQIPRTYNYDSFAGRSGSPFVKILYSTNSVSRIYRTLVRTKLVSRIYRTSKTNMFLDIKRRQQARARLLGISTKFPSSFGNLINALSISARIGFALPPVIRSQQLYRLRGVASGILLIQKTLSSRRKSRQRSIRSRATLLGRLQSQYYPQLTVRTQYLIYPLITKGTDRYYRQPSFRQYILGTLDLYIFTTNLDVPLSRIALTFKPVSQASRQEVLSRTGGVSSLYRSPRSRQRAQRRPNLSTRHYYYQRLIPRSNVKLY